MLLSLITFSLLAVVCYNVHVHIMVLIAFDLSLRLVVPTARWIHIRLYLIILDSKFWILMIRPDLKQYFLE
jgi:hypothetical protein